MITIKKIEFGFNNDQVPNGSWEGIGIRQDLLINEGEYLGSVSFRGDQYIICNITNHNINRLIVRQALYDMFSDGSGILYLNQDETPVSISMEDYINKKGIRENIKTVEDIIKLGDGIFGSKKSFKLLEMDNKIIATSILPELFNEMNEIIKYNQKSITSLAMEKSKRNTL